MVMDENWPDMFDMGHVRNSNLDLLTKFSTCNRKTEFKNIHPRNISQMIMIVPISMRIDSVSLKESQWKLRQQHDQNFPMEG